MPPSQREGDRKAVEGVYSDRRTLPQSANADSPLREGAKFEYFSTVGANWLRVRI